MECTSRTAQHILFRAVRGEDQRAPGAHSNKVDNDLLLRRRGRVWWGTLWVTHRASPQWHWQGVSRLP
eukprot:12931000-Prorocentrum_lima.AAC.1